MVELNRVDGRYLVTDRGHTLGVVSRNAHFPWVFRRFGIQTIILVADTLADMRRQLEREYPDHHEEDRP